MVQQRSNESKAQQFDLQLGLTAWIDELQPGNSCRSVAVTQLFAELIRRDLFSYGRYLQNMIARGETDQRAQVVSCYL